MSVKRGLGFNGYLVYGDPMYPLYKTNDYARMCSYGFNTRRDRLPGGCFVRYDSKVE